MSTAEQLIDDVVNLDVDGDAWWDLDEGAPKDPKLRALHRIKSLLDRFDDLSKVDQHTTARAKKTRNAEKLKGIIWAAKKLKLKNAVKAAQQQLALVG